MLTAARVSATGGEVAAQVVDGVGDSEVPGNSGGVDGVQ
jgi:hypothetical protein